MKQIYFSYCIIISYFNALTLSFYFSIIPNKSNFSFSKLIILVTFSLSFYLRELTCYSNILAVFSETNSISSIDLT